jgi:hypothetical protein
MGTAASRGGLAFFFATRLAILRRFRAKRPRPSRKSALAAGLKGAEIIWIGGERESKRPYGELGYRLKGKP